MTFFLPRQGLRLNRTLVFLSLLNNQIGDYGATRLAEVCVITQSASLVLSVLSEFGGFFCTMSTDMNLCKASDLSNNFLSVCIFHSKTLGEFSLTHEEVLERRKLLLEKSQALAAAMSSLRQDSDQSPEDQHAGASSSSLGGKQDGKAKKKVTCEDTCSGERTGSRRNHVSNFL